MSRRLSIGASVFALAAMVAAPPAAAQTARPTAESARAKLATMAAPKGVLQIVVSLADQRAVLYSDGALVAQSPVSTGKAGHETPAGVFNVLQKNRHHVSNLYDDAKMPYMQRLTWSGVALHQGALPGYAASHGCVRLPQAFADLLWRSTRRGARVIVAHNAVAPVAIAHPTLFRAPVDVPMATAPVALAQAGRFTAQGTIVIDDADHDPVGSIASPVGAPDRRKGRVSVLVSRKEQRLYVRQDGEAVFDTAVTIRDPDRALGTHVFTALGRHDDLRWNVVSIPSRQRASVPDATSALDRIDMPSDAAAHIGALLTPGASLIVSDIPISRETGRDTDFIILTP